LGGGNVGVAGVFVPCRKAEFLGEGSVIENAAERPRECLLFVGVGAAVLALLVGEVSAGE
jgi:hypothetical protein